MDSPCKFIYCKKLCCLIWPILNQLILIDISMHEIALYDISTTIDYILNATGQLNLIYVGHSLGTTMSLILLSTKTEFNNKIRLVINMATVGNFNNPRNLMRFFYDYGPYLEVRKLLRF